VHSECTSVSLNLEMLCCCSHEELITENNTTYQNPALLTVGMTNTLKPVN